MEKNTTFERLEALLNRFSILLAGFCPEETPDLGSMLMLLDELSTIAKDAKPNTFYQVAASCLHYVENMTLESMDNLKPVKDARLLLEALLRHMKRGVDFTFETADVIRILDAPLLKNTETLPEFLLEPKTREKKRPTMEESPGEVESISDEDMEIMADFVAEAKENLDAIEVHLIKLEQDPSDKDIINNIFRPFHTIKGVAGFLSLKKINQLAHATENLLDSAQSDNFLINDIATDAILESVNMLKQMVDRVKQGAAKGVRLSDQDMDINPLRDKLQTLQRELTRANKPLLGEILVKKGVIDQASLDQTLACQRQQPGKKIGQMLVEAKKADPVQIAQALIDQGPGKRKGITQVKVNTEKLDNLVDYAGELVITQSMLRQKVSQDPSLIQSVNHLGQIISNMQHIAMSMRMIPIKSTFMKMIRLVRDLSRNSGKKVTLHMNGGETEIDRNVVDALYEPMVHMIRNSVDHGIEALNQRQEKGKPDQGNIYLSAFHKGGHIVIEIEDDGKGLDRDRILEKAMDQDLFPKVTTPQMPRSMT